MFENHNPLIREYAQTGAPELADVARFVIATVQQQIEHVPEIAAEFRTIGRESRYAFGWKANAIDWHNANAAQTHADTLAIFHGADCARAAAEGVTAYFASLPGLGLAKGGFMAQLCFGVSGCLDSHNLARFGIPPARFSASAYKGLRRADNRQARVAEYVDAVDAQGGCAALWDSWCDYVAALRPDRFESGFDVSALHVEGLELADDLRRERAGLNTIPF